jgi:hypothetical protein
MRYFLQSVLIVMGISTILLVVLRGLGYITHSCLNLIKPLRLEAVTSPKTDYPIIGIFVIVGTGFHLAYFNLSVVPIFRFFLLISLVGFIIEFRHEKLSAIKDYLLYNLIGLWIVFPQLFISGQKNSTNPVISLGNHDIAYYIAAAAQFFQSGFVNQGAVNLNDLNVAARNYQYFTPTAVFAFEKSNSPIWIGQFATPTLVLFITLGSLIVAKITKLISPRANAFHQFSISAIFSLMSINLYILSSFFLAQAIAVMIILRIVQILVTEMLSKKYDIHSRSNLLVAALMTLCVFSYPALLFPALALLVLGLSLASFRNKSFTKLLNLGISTAIALVISWLYLPTAIDLFLILKDGSFGWPLQPLSPFAVLLTPSLIGAPLTKVSLIFMWIVFCISAYVLIGKVGLAKIEQNLIRLIMGASILFVILFAEIRGLGYGNYGVWKLQSYVAPFVILLILAFCLKHKNFLEPIVYILFGVVLLNPLIIWTVNTGKSTSNSFMQMYNTRELNQGQSLNIDLKDFSETMLATTFGDRNKFFINSNSYLQTSLDPNSCTLTNAGSQAYAFQVPINNDYVIASQDPSECSQWLKLESNKKLFFNNTLQKRFGSGWWESENWGTWSRAVESYVFLKPNISAEPENFTLRFNFNSLSDGNGDGVNISIFVNNSLSVESADLDYSRPQLIDLKLNRMSSNNNELSIKFVVNRLITPSISGKSPDSRALGVGLISVELLKTGKN